MILKTSFATASGLGLMASLLSSAALAEVPQVATDIAPVHSLVAMVMGDLGTPAMIVRSEASPHGYAMRPSEAQALNDADLVVWIGAALTPWLEGPLDNLAGDAQHLELLSVEGAVLHDYREGATFAAHDHGDEDEDHAHGDHDHEDDHDGHDLDAHDHEEVAADDHDHDHAADGDDHDHAGTDSHAWLDPANARLWLGAIAAELSALDPDNAATYAANAAASQDRIRALEDSLQAELAPLRDMRFVVFHDAYQYFERRFGLSAAGAISLSDASTPSAGRIAELQEAVSAMGADCVFSEPQFNADLIGAVFADTVAVRTLDPLGFAATPGPDLYPQILQSMAAEFTGCLDN